VGDGVVDGLVAIAATMAAASNVLRVDGPRLYAQGISIESKNVNRRAAGTVNAESASDLAHMRRLQDREVGLWPALGL